MVGAPGDLSRCPRPFPDTTVAVPRTDVVDAGARRAAQRGARSVELAGLEMALRRLWSLPVEGLLPMPLSFHVERIRRAVAAYDGTDIEAEGAGAKDVVGRAHEAAACWLAGPEVDTLFEPAPPVLGHGDPHPSNYLWDGTEVRVIDFEDSGVSDVAVELANIVEHLSCRATDWTDFLAKFPVSPERLLAARRLWSILWLTLVRPGGRSYHRNPPSISAHQAARVLSLLGGRASA